MSIAFMLLGALQFALADTIAVASAKEPAMLWLLFIFRFGGIFMFGIGLLGEIKVMK